MSRSSRYDGSRGVGPGRVRGADRLRDQPNAKHRPFGFVQKLHLPFGVFCEVPRDAAHEFTANFSHFCPGRTVVGKFDAAVGRAGKMAILNAKKIERHGGNPMLRPLKARGQPITKSNNWIRLNRFALFSLQPEMADLQWEHVLQWREYARGQNRNSKCSVGGPLCPGEWTSSGCLVMSEKCQRATFFG